LATLIALVAALFGAIGLEPAIAAAPPAQTYSYDSHHDTSAPTYPNTERGPLSDFFCVHDAVDRWSHGASARPKAAPAGSTTTYATSAKVVQVALLAGTTQPRDAGDLSAPPPSPSELPQKPDA
jgi:hypothetical protein